MEKYTLPERNVLFSDKNELDTTLAVTLDEYCPNVVRVVRCDVFPMLLEKTLTQHGLEYSGKNIFRVVYVSDYNDSLKSVNFEEDFSGVLKTDSDYSENDADLCLCLKPVSSSAKILSARQMELKGRILVSGEIVSNVETEIFGKQAENNDDICVLEESFDSCQRVKLCCEKIMLETDAALNQDELSVGEMLYTQMTPYITRTECSDGKLSLWGEVNASFVYVPENTEEAPHNTTKPVCVTRKLPFDAEIYADGITENGYAVLEAEPIYVKTGVSYDPYGENRVLSVSADMHVSGCVFECAKLCVCTDAFGIERGICIKPVSVNFEKIADTVDESVHISEKLHADTRNFSEITDCTMTARVTGTEMSDGKMYAVLRFDASILGMGENESVNYMQSGFNTKVPIDSSVYPSGIKADLYVSVKNAACAVRSGEMTVTADVMLYGVLTEKNAVNAIGDVVPCENQTQEEKGQIIVYYPDENDTVWNTAKKYAVNPQTLKEENGIDGDSLSGVRMLVITK